MYAAYLECPGFAVAFAEVNRPAGASTALGEGIASHFSRFSDHFTVAELTVVHPGRPLYDRNVS